MKILKGKNNTEISTDTLNYRHIKQDNFLYYGLLVYTIIFYSQIAGRFPVLALLRIELLIGSILLITIIARMIHGEIDFKENKLNIAIFLLLLVMFVSILFAYVHSRAFTTLSECLSFLLSIQ